MPLDPISYSAVKKLEKKVDQLEVSFSTNELRVNTIYPKDTDTVTVQGNLNVVGNVTYIETTNLQVKDNIIELNSGETGSGVTLGSAGITIDRGTEPDAQVIWDENNDKFVFKLEDGTKLPVEVSIVNADTVNATNGNITTANIDTANITKLGKNLDADSHNISNVSTLSANTVNATTIDASNITISNQAILPISSSDYIVVVKTNGSCSVFKYNGEKLFTGSDSEAIQFAINYAKNNNINVIKLTGTFNIDNTVTIDSASKLTIIGPAKIIVSASPAIRITKSSDITLQNLIFDGQGNAVTAIECVGWNRFLRFENLSFYKLKDKAMYFYKDTDRNYEIFLKAIYIKECGKGIVMQNTVDVAWYDAFVEFCDDNGIEILGDTSGQNMFHVHVYLCKGHGIFIKDTYGFEMFDVYGDTDYKHGIYLTGCKQGQLIGCAVFNNGRQALEDGNYVWDGLHIEQCENIVVKGLLAENWATEKTQRYGVYVDANSYSLVLDGIFYHPDNSNKEGLLKVESTNNVQIINVLQYDKVEFRNKSQVIMESDLADRSCEVVFGSRQFPHKGYMKFTSDKGIEFTIYDADVGSWSSVCKMYPDKVVSYKPIILSSDNYYAHLKLGDTYPGELKFKDKSTGYETIIKADPSSNNNRFVLLFYDGSSWMPMQIWDKISGYSTIFLNFVPASDNALNLGDANHRWKNVYCVNLYTGDIKLMNNWTVTERDENGNIIKNGVRILNDKGEEIFRITEDGIYFKGKKLKLVFEE